MYTDNKNSDEHVGDIDDQEKWSPKGGYWEELSSGLLGYQSGSVEKWFNQRGTDVFHK